MRSASRPCGAGRTIRHLASSAPVTPKLKAWTNLPCAHTYGQTRDHRDDQVPHLATQTHHRTAATCRQQDVDEWLATGPTTRQRSASSSSGPTRAKSTPRCSSPPTGPEQPRAHPRAATGMDKGLLTDDIESLPYRVAGTLLLLFGQPLTKSRPCRQRQSQSPKTRCGSRLAKNRSPSHNHSQTCSQPHGQPAESENRRRGDHTMAVPQQPPRPAPRPQFIMSGCATSASTYSAARNTALQSLVVEAPPPLVAELLGYSYNTTQRHAQIAAQPWAAT